VPATASRLAGRTADRRGHLDHRLINGLMRHYLLNTQMPADEALAAVEELLKEEPA